MPADSSSEHQTFKKLDKNTPNNCTENYNFLACFSNKKAKRPGFLDIVNTVVVSLSCVHISAPCKWFYGALLNAPSRPIYHRVVFFLLFNRLRLQAQKLMAFLGTLHTQLGKKLQIMKPLTQKKQITLAFT